MNEELTEEEKDALKHVALKLETFEKHRGNLIPILQMVQNNLAYSERNKPYLYATDSNGDPYSPGWWTLNFKGSYAFNKAFLVTFGVENILNYRYRAYSSGITAPGTNFIAAFRYSF